MRGQKIEVLPRRPHSSVREELRAYDPSLASRPSLVVGTKLDLAPDVDAPRLMAELSGRGVTVVSLNPVRETLEDYFIKQVQGASPRRTD